LSRDVVVVLHYRGLADTERCVESLVKGSPDAQVLVVDNGSEDGALDHLVRRWPALATLQNGENLGFASRKKSFANDLRSAACGAIEEELIEPVAAESESGIGKVPELLAASEVECNPTDRRWRRFLKLSPGSQRLERGLNLRRQKFAAHFVARESRFLDNAHACAFA